MPESILERDIGFYEGCLEQDKDCLRRCAPSSEAYWQEQIRLTSAVVGALRDLQAHTIPVAPSNEERPWAEDKSEGN